MLDAVRSEGEERGGGKEGGKEGGQEGDKDNLIAKILICRIQRSGRGRGGLATRCCCDNASPLRLPGIQINYLNLFFGL